MPAQSLIYVGKHTQEKMNKLNIFTIGDLARADEKMLIDHFGILGSKYKKIANGTDNEPVKSESDLGKTKSIGNGTTTIRDLTSRDEIETTILTLAEKVAFRMRQVGVAGKTVSLSLRDNTLVFSGHSQTYPTPTSNASEITSRCMHIFDTFWSPPLKIRSVRIAVSSLTPSDQEAQLDMFDSAKNAKNSKLDTSLDKIRSKYGFYAVRRAKTLDKEYLDYFEADEEDT